MSTKATPAKKAPAKSPAKPAPIRPPKEQPPELNINVTKSAETTSLTGTGVLGIEIGSDEAVETHYRITANNAGGSFSGEWVSWPDIYAVCNGHPQITSILFRALPRFQAMFVCLFDLRYSSQSLPSVQVLFLGIRLHHGQATSSVAYSRKIPRARLPCPLPMRNIRIREKTASEQ